MSVPVIVLGESLVDAVVEVLVMGEDNVATDIVQLEESSGQLLFYRSLAATTYETLGGGVSAGKTTSLVRRVDNQP